MGAWDVKGSVRGAVSSWRDKFPELDERVEKVKVPTGRGIPYEGTEIYRYKETPKNLDQALRERVRNDPEQEAFVFPSTGERLTWREVDRKVSNVSYQLRHEYDFQKGDRLALIVPGSPAYVLGFLAAVRLGGLAVPINLALPAEGIKDEIQEVKAKILIVEASIWNSQIRSIRDELDSVETIVVAGEDGNEGSVSFSAISAEKAPGDVYTEIDEWDLCAINFTSGTTGDPKPIQTMHTNALGCAFAVRDSTKLEKDDVILGMAPLFHNTAVYLNLLPSFVIGYTLVVMKEFDPARAVQLVDQEDVTGSVAAPVMFWFMMHDSSSEKFDLSTFKKFAYGGHAPSESFIEELENTFNPVASVNAGSISENTAHGIARPTEDVLDKPMSLGLATPNTEIALFDEEGQEITEPNEIGEIAYKGQQTTKGYRQRPEKTERTFRSDGYVLSGDYAKFDEDGYVFLMDRKKDMIVRGGENVYCVEVENVLYNHDDVLSAAVVGVPDHVFSERVKAVVRPKPDRSITPDKIRDHCRDYLASYEVPEYVVITTEEIPTNPAGKTLKPELVDEWGVSEDTEATVTDELEEYISSLPASLLEKGLFKTTKSGNLISPREAQSHLKEGTTVGDDLRDVISNQGIVGLLKP